MIEVALYAIIGSVVIVVVIALLEHDACFVEAGLFVIVKAIGFAVSIRCPSAIHIYGIIQAQGSIEAEVHVDVIALRVVIVIVRIADDETARQVLIVKIILAHLVGVECRHITIALCIPCHAVNVKGGILRRERFKLSEFIARVEDEVATMLPLHLTHCEEIRSGTLAHLIPTAILNDVHAQFLFRATQA